MSKTLETITAADSQKPYERLFAATVDNVTPELFQAAFNDVDEDPRVAAQQAGRLLNVASVVAQNNPQSEEWQEIRSQASSLAARVMELIALSGETWDASDQTAIN